MMKINRPFSYLSFDFEFVSISISYFVLYHPSTSMRQHVMKSAQYKGNRSVTVGASEAIEPGPGQARLEVSYCGICGTDIHIFHGAMDQRVSMPQIIGHEVSATVAEVGDGVTTVHVGDRVAVRPLCFGEPATFDKGHAHVGKNLKFIGIDMPGGMQSSWTVPAYTLHQASRFAEHGTRRDDRAGGRRLPRCSTW